ncbi:MAG: hypothetical protein BJ554DRAFT_3749, partial [Olpidium bornovanus]
MISPGHAESGNRNSREGTVCLWTPTLKLQRTINTKDFVPGTSWVSDAVYMQDQGKLAIVTDDRQLILYDLTSIKPRILMSIAPLENNPLCITYAGRFCRRLARSILLFYICGVAGQRTFFARSGNFDEDGDLLIFGDDGGYVNVLHFNRRAFVDNVNEGRPVLDPATLVKKENLAKGQMYFYRVRDVFRVAPRFLEDRVCSNVKKLTSLSVWSRLRRGQRKIHSDWVLSIRYHKEVNGFISCSSESNRSLVIGDLERKSIRYLHVDKGIRCFDYCRRPTFLVTGGRDKMMCVYEIEICQNPAAVGAARPAPPNDPCEPCSWAPPPPPTPLISLRRLWNPYVLSKPAGSLRQNAVVVDIM